MFSAHEPRGTAHRDATDRPQIAAALACVNGRVSSLCLRYSLREVGLGAVIALVSKRWKFGFEHQL